MRQRRARNELYLNQDSADSRQETVLEVDDSEKALRSLLGALAEISERRFHELVRLSDAEWVRLRSAANRMGKPRIFLEEK